MDICSVFVQCEEIYVSVRVCKICTTYVGVTYIYIYIILGW